MKKLLLLVALVGGLGLMASTNTAEAGPGYGGGFNGGHNGGYNGYHGSNNTYRYWNNSYNGSYGYRTNFGGYPRTTYVTPFNYGYGGYAPTYAPVYGGSCH